MAHCQYHASSRRDHNGEFITTRESLSYQTSLRHMLTPSYIVSVARLDHQLIWLWAAAKPQPPMQQPTGFMGLADSTAYVCHVMCATHILMISLICGCRKRTPPPPHTHTHSFLILHFPVDRKIVSQVWRAVLLLFLYYGLIVFHVYFKRDC